MKKFKKKTEEVETPPIKKKHSLLKKSENEDVERKRLENKTKHITEEDLRQMIAGYLQESFTVDSIIYELRHYRCGGLPVDRAKVMALRSSMTDIAPPAQGATPTSDVDARLKAELLDAYKAGKWKLAHKLERALGIRKKGTHASGGMSKMQSALAEFADIAGQVDKIRGVLGGGPQAVGGGRQPLRWDSLDPNPGVAQSQVMASSLDSVADKVCNTMYEVSGKKRPQDTKSTDEQAIKETDKKIKALEKKGMKIKMMYASCPNCQAMIPRNAAICVSCNTVFKVTRENMHMAKKAEQMMDKTEEAPEEEETEEDEREEAKEDFSDEDEFMDQWFEPKGDNGYLWRLKNKIETDDDPKRSCDAMWAWVKSEKDQKKLLFVSQKGFHKIIRVAKIAASTKPSVIRQYNLKELFAFYKTPAAVKWMNTFFDRVKFICDEEGIKLSLSDEKHLNKKMRHLLGNKASNGAMPVVCEKCGERMKLSELSGHKCKGK